MPLSAGGVTWSSCGLRGHSGQKGQQTRPAPLPCWRLGPGGEAEKAGAADVTYRALNPFCIPPTAWTIILPPVPEKTRRQRGKNRAAAGEGENPALPPAGRVAPPSHFCLSSEITDIHVRCWFLPAPDRALLPLTHAPRERDGNGQSEWGPDGEWTTVQAPPLTWKGG